jgi:hypothetical protein
MGKASLFERLGLVSRPSMSMENFREQVIEVLLLEHPTAAVQRRNRDEIEVGWERRLDEPLTFSVSQAYGWYLKKPAMLIDAIREIATYILISSVTPTLHALAVLVRSAEYGPEGEPMNAHLRREIVDGLFGVVVIDNLYGYQHLTRRSLGDEFGLDEASLWDRALENTVVRLEIKEVPLERGVPTTLLRGDGLATSLLLADTFWDPPRQVETLVAAAVAPNKLVVAPERDSKSLRKLRQLMERDPLSADWRHFKGLLARRQGRWEVLR